MSSLTEGADDIGDKSDPGLVAANNKWAATVERLCAEDRERFAFAKTLERDPSKVLVDVLAATNKKKEECMKRRWKLVIKGRTIILRDVLEKISVWVTKVKEIGDIAVSYDPTHAALPWAAIRFILQASFNDVEVFGYVLHSIESITNAIAVGAIFELRYLRRHQTKLELFDQLSGAVVSQYAAILQYLSAVLHYYSHGTATRLAKSIGSSKADFEEKYKPFETAKKAAWDLAQLAEAEKSDWILSSLDHVQDEQRSHAARDQQQFEALGSVLKEIQAPIDRISNQLAEIQDGLERETRAKIIRAIPSIHYSSHHKGARKGRLKGSGQWLLQKHEYRAWREESSPSAPRLHGIPGSGKTKLASLVVDELEGRENLAFFYYPRQLGPPTSCCAPNGPILAPVVAHYEEAVFGTCSFEDQAWSSEESAEVLLQLMGEYPAVTLVIDALDEVAQEDRQELMDILSQLLRDSPNLLKIFVSSRSNYDIALHFEGCPNVYIDSDNTGDISAFIDDRLTSTKLLHGRLSADLRSKIAKTLLQRASGMFRWVNLQIQALRPLKVAADIEARLGALPVTLEELYWEIYQEILNSGEHAADLALFTFQWLMCARDTIDIDAFAHMACYALQRENGPVFSPIEISDVCSNLVVVRSKSFEFAHLSVREFLEGLLPKRKMDKLLPDTSHGRIAIACLRLLSDENGMPERAPQSAMDRNAEPNLDFTHSTPACHDGVEASDSRNNPADPSRLEAAIYAVRCWVRHVCDSGDVRKSEQLSDMIKTFLLDPIMFEVSARFKSWCQLFTNVDNLGRNNKSNNSNPNFTEIKVYDFNLDSPNLVGANLDDHRRVTYLRDSAEGPPNPIWLACLHDWTEVVEFLYAANYTDLERPRTVRSLQIPHSFWSNRLLVSDDYVPYSSPLTPLWFTVLSKNVRLTEAILQHCPDPLQSQLFTTLTPLAQAAASNHGDVVTALLRKEHPIKAQADALICAAANGALDTLTVLVDHGPQVVPTAGHSAILLGFENGYVGVVSFLLDRGVVLDQGDSLLYRAVASRNPDILRTLLQRGVEGPDGLSKALDIAVSIDKKDLAALLLQYGARKEPEAVFRARLNGHDLATSRLVEAGFNEITQPMLHYAAEMAYAGAIETLVQGGHDVNAYDAEKQTPLHIAANRGHVSCVRILLENGADVLAEDGEGRIPLDLAEIGGHADCEESIRDRMMRLLEELQREKENRRTTYR